MIRPVKINIDCGDEYCEKCCHVFESYYDDTTMRRPDQCSLFNHITLDKKHNKPVRCDVCKQAESQIMQPLYIQREESRHKAIANGKIDWEPPTLEQLRKRHKELEKKLGI